MAILQLNSPAVCIILQLIKMMIHCLSRIAFQIIKGAHRVLKYMERREQAVENSRTDPQAIIPQSLFEILINSWQGDEVNHIDFLPCCFLLNLNYKRLLSGNVNIKNEERFGQ